MILYVSLAIFDRNIDGLLFFIITIAGAGKLKISDFGLAKVLLQTEGERGIYKMTGEAGSYRYMYSHFNLLSSYSFPLHPYNQSHLGHQRYFGMTKLIAKKLINILLGSSSGSC